MAAAARPADPRGRPRRRARTLAIAALIAALIAGGAAAAVLGRHHSGTAGAGSSSPGGQRALGAADATRRQAARWVARQVSRSAIVACDPAMCAALHGDGLMAASLQVLRSTTADPLGADVIVATPAVRSQFGRRLASVYAPAVLARFGSGAAQIAVRVVAPGGAAVYEQQLGQDMTARKNVAAQLLGNHQIQLSASARAQLRAGEVDARLLLMLPALAHVHPVQVLSFGGQGPGADPDIPLCSAELATADHPSGMSQSRYGQWLTGYFRGQRPPYNAQVATGQQDGQGVVTVLFALPSPLGLINGG